jgi:hypothetical protein
MDPGFVRNGKRSVGSMSFRRGVLLLGAPVLLLSGVLIVFEQYATVLVVAGLASFAFVWSQYFFAWYKRQLTQTEVLCFVDDEVSVSVPEHLPLRT